MNKKFIVTWKNQVADEDGMILSRTTIICNEDVLLSVLKRLPNSEYDLEEEPDYFSNDMAYYKHIVQGSLGVTSGMGASATTSIYKNRNFRVHAGNPPVTGGAFVGSNLSNIVIPEPDKFITYSNMYVIPNFEGYSREDQYKIPVRKLLLDDAIGE